MSALPARKASYELVYRETMEVPQYVTKLHPYVNQTSSPGKCPTCQ